MEFGSLANLRALESDSPANPRTPEFGHPETPYAAIHPAAVEAYYLVPESAPRPRTRARDSNCESTKPLKTPAKLDETKDSGSPSSSEKPQGQSPLENPEAAADAPAEESAEHAKAISETGPAAQGSTDAAVNPAEKEFAAAKTEKIPAVEFRSESPGDRARKDVHQRTGVEV